MARFLYALLLVLGVAHAKYSGDGTAYSGDGEKDATGRNACGFGGVGDRWERYYCALPTSMFDSGDCGRCANVCGDRGCVKVKIVDSCASCDHGDIDLSTAALKKATGYAWDRKSVSWSITSCGGDDGGDDYEERPRKRRGKKGKKNGKKKCRGKKCRRNGKRRDL